MRKDFEQSSTTNRVKPKDGVDRSNTLINGRRDWIRTSDLLHPKQVLYQAEPRAENRILKLDPET